MAKPKELGKVQVRELTAALGSTDEMILVRRIVGGASWAIQRVEYALILTEDQVAQLAEFKGESYHREVL